MIEDYVRNVVYSLIMNYFGYFKDVRNVVYSLIMNCFGYFKDVEED